MASALPSHSPSPPESTSTAETATGVTPVDAPTASCEATVKLIHELAIKRSEQIDKAWDQVNTRAGLVFGFSSFLLTALGKALELLKDHAPWQRVTVLSGFGLLFAALTVCCLLALRIQRLRLLPDAVAVANDTWGAGEAVARERLASRIAHDANHNHGQLQKKTVHLRNALVALALLTSWVLGSLVLAGVQSTPVAPESGRECAVQERTTSADRAAETSAPQALPPQPPVQNRSPPAEALPPAAVANDAAQPGGEMDAGVSAPASSAPGA